MQIFVCMCAPGTQPTHESQQYCTLFSGYYKNKQLLITVHLFCSSILTAAELKRLKIQIENKEEFGKYQLMKCQWYYFTIRVHSVDWRLLTATNGIRAYPWHICKGCQVSYQKLDEKETWGVLAVHSWTKAG